jgi:uncharacterized protein
VEVLVVNGDRDPFGVPDPAPGVQVCVLPGVGHDLGRDPAQVGRVVAGRLRRWTAVPG